MKLLKDNTALHAEEFSNASPYVIMFGPDKCGATNKVSIASAPNEATAILTPTGSLYFQAQESKDWRVRGEASQERTNGSHCQDQLSVHSDCKF